MLMEARLRGRRRIRALAGILIFGIFAWAVNYYMESVLKFDDGTFINGIYCSNLTTGEVAEKLSSKAKNLTFTVITPDGRLEEYKPTQEEISSFEIPNKEMKSILKHFMEAQEEDDSIKTFHVDVFSLDEDGLRNYLLTIPELNGENMSAPEDAYLKFGKNGLLEIIEGKTGNQINFEEAAEYASMQLTKFNTNISFVPMAEVEPDIWKNDEKLIQTKERINNCLNTVVNFQLTNGETVTLDKSVTRDWIIQKEGSFEIDESQIAAFVSELAEKVRETKSTIYMPATGIGWVKVPIGFAVIKVDQEAQVEAIKEYLETGETHEVIPKYVNLNIEDFFNCYIEVDKTRQMVWMYVNGKCILETKCVTGLANTERETPTGIYLLQGKRPDAVLTDNKTYWSPVKFWMPFNGGIGFHDAPWKEIDGVEYFGGTYYLTSGSHGCVNLPTWAAKIMYQNITYDMPIIVYNSSKIISTGNVYTSTVGSLNPLCLYIDTL